MQKALAVTAALALLCLGSLAQAITIDTVPVGDQGNAADTRYADPPRTPPGYGSVAYDYLIGKYEVTAGQYCDFLNHKAKSDPYGLYSTNMPNTSTDPYKSGCKIQRSGSAGNYTYSVASDWANRPVSDVSFWDACRFANWLHNGQGNGDTETGAYNLSGGTIQRNPGAKWFVPSEDEWYKAAYYKAHGQNAGYWEYPTQSNSVPSNDLSNPDGGNNANFYQDGFTIDYPYYRTNVGEFENSESAYNTFDQGGNVWEWNEAIIGSDRGWRGGPFQGFDYHLRALVRASQLPGEESSTTGFRVAAAVPEPSSLLALGSGILALAGMIRRKQNGSWLMANGGE